METLNSNFVFNPDGEKDMARKAKLKTYNSILQRVAKGGNYSKAGCPQTPSRKSSPSKNLENSRRKSQASNQKKTEIKHKFESEETPIKSFRGASYNQPKTAKTTDKSLIKTTSTLLLNNVEVVDIKKIPLPMTESINSTLTPVKSKHRQDSHIVKHMTPAHKARASNTKDESKRISYMRSDIKSKTDTNTISKSPLKHKSTSNRIEVKNKKMSDNKIGRTPGRSRADRKTSFKAGIVYLCELMTSMRPNHICKDHSFVWNAISVESKRIGVMITFADEFRKYSLLKRSIAAILHSKRVLKSKAILRVAYRCIHRSLRDIISRRIGKSFADIRNGGLRRYIHMKTPTYKTRSHIDLCDMTDDKLTIPGFNTVSRKLVMTDSSRLEFANTDNARYRGTSSMRQDICDTDDADAFRSNLRRIILMQLLLRLEKSNLCIKAKCAKVCL